MHGKKVTRLEYESYESMALKEMESVCSTIRNKWSDVRNIAIFHRLGQVLIKEESIVIAISSPHRKESLEAVNFCIDEVKKMVPIWKKVVFLSFI
jgi:molybdopterin synthase catalytic subunit